MTKRSSTVRRLQRSLAGGVLLVALLFPAGAAQAEAIVFRFSETHTETFTSPLEGCLPGDPVATWTLTETATGQVVDTGTVFTVRGVNEFDARVELPDGMYLESGRLNRDRYIFVVNPTAQRLQRCDPRSSDNLCRRRDAAGINVHPRRLPHHLQGPQRQRNA